MGALNDWVRSPVVLAGAAMALAFGAGVLALPSRMLVDALDGFCIFAGIMVLIVYGPAFMDVVRERRPDRAQLMIAGIVLVALGYASIRGLRALAYEIAGTTDTEAVRFLFGFFTVVMLFGTFLHIAATGRVHGPVQASAWWAVAAAVFGGSAFGALTLVLRWWF